MKQATAAVQHVFAQAMETQEHKSHIDAQLRLLENKLKQRYHAYHAAPNGATTTAGAEGTTATISRTLTGESDEEQSHPSPTGTPCNAVYATCSDPCSSHDRPYERWPWHVRGMGCLGSASLAAPQAIQSPHVRDARAVTNAVRGACPALAHSESVITTTSSHVHAHVPLSIGLSRSTELPVSVAAAAASSVLLDTPSKLLSDTTVNSSSEPLAPQLPSLPVSSSLRRK